MHVILLPDESQQAEIQALVRFCESQDGASPCVQMDHSLNALPDMPSWLLSYRDGELAGLASIFAPMREEAEITLCVKPDCRGEGLGSVLLQRATSVLREHGYARILVVVDRSSVEGQRWAGRRSDALQHTEYTLRLVPSAPMTSATQLTVRDATPEDLPSLLHVCHSAYGDQGPDLDAFIRTSLTAINRRGFAGLLGEDLLATCFVGFEEDIAWIHTVAVRKDAQGKGYGKELLSRAMAEVAPLCREFRLDVDSSNTVAHALYQHMGFETFRAVDYLILKA